VGFSETVLAAMIGATATIGASIFQLVLHWRKQSGDRRTAAKGGFRSLLWMLTLMLASAVGGFAYSEYLGLDRRDETHQLREELQKQLASCFCSSSRN